MKFKQWKFPKQRTEGFSDGVYAIIITLLILEIKLPHLVNPASSDELLGDIIILMPKIISWMISFFFISVMWVQHHNLLRMADTIDYGFVWINTIGLFFMCFLPFPTALMGDYPNNRLAVLLFGLITFLATLSQVWLYYYIYRNNLSQTYDRRQTIKNVKKAFFLAPLLLLLATAFSFISIMIPFFIYTLVPIMFLLPLDKEKINPVP